MSGGRRLRLTTPAIAAALVSLSCTTTPFKDPCVPGGEPGARYNVPLIERYAATSTRAQFLDGYVNLSYPSCGNLDGLAEGQQLAISVGARKAAHSMGQSGCYVHRGDTAAPPGWSFTGEGSLATLRPYQVTFVSQLARIQNCSGQWDLSLEAIGDPAREPSPERPPPLLVRRHFVSERAQDCPALGGKTGPAECEDVWISSLRP